MGIRLNLGCGNKKLSGYIGVDFADNYSGDKPDVESDLRALPFADDYADEVLAVHVLEHFYVWEAADVLKEWKRVLKPGGKIAIEVPCLDKIINLYFQHQGQPPVNLSMWGFYGDPSYKDPRMVHHWCYSVGALRALLETVGFKNIVEHRPKFHVEQRDMRMEAVNV